MTRLFYAVADPFPPWRLDVDELFSRQLPRSGIEITWSMFRERIGPCAQDHHRSQRVYLPLRLSDKSRINRLTNKALQITCELGLFFRLLVGPRYAIIQVRDRRYFFAGLAWLVSRLRGAKFVYWLSYPFPEHFIEMASDGRSAARFSCLMRGRLSWFYVYRIVMKLADHVFVQSDQMRQDVANYGIAPGKMTVVPMGVPPALVDWKGATEGQKVQRGKVVYVGTLARVRRLTVLIETIGIVRKHNPEAHLVIVGEGDTPNDRGELEALAAQLGLTDAVTFTGFVPMEQAWAQAASAEVCLSPFYPTFVLRSTSPTKLVEYMALGRPVVANDHPEQSAILRESGAGLCVAWGAESFATAIVELLANPEKAQAMGARGPTWVLANRTYDKLAANVYERYQALLKDKG